MFLRIALAYLCQHTYNAPPRRGARAVEWGGLENRCASNRTEGSNPSLSAIP